MSGRTHSTEARRKISEFQRGKLKTDVTKEKLSLRLNGRIISNTHRAKISAAQKGRKASTESKAKISASLKDKPWSEARRNAPNKKHKTWMIQFEDNRESLIVSNLEKWCNDNGLTYHKAIKTVYSKTYRNGVMVTKLFQ